jgi:nucleotide-binding universal stress UspA family protein
MFEHIVVGADFSPSGERLLKGLPALSRLGATRIHLVHVTGVRHPTLSTLEQLGTQRKQLEATCTWLESQGFEAKHQVVMGDPSREITRVAVNCDASLIMVGSRSQSRVRDAFVGSVAWGVVNQSPIPVLISRLPAEDAAAADRSPIQLDHVIFPTDLSAMAGTAFQLLEKLTRGGAVQEAVLVHVIAATPGGAETPEPIEVRRLAERLRAAGAERVEVAITRGTPVEEILKVTRDRPTALLVMGSHGRGMLADALLGSVSRAVVRQAHGSVLLVPSRARLG